MDAQFWHQRWDEGKIGFHQPDVNKRLKEYWSRVFKQDSADADGKHAPEDVCVFVPLCGKSLDMLWLHQQGSRVLGVELSATAATAFFEENNLGFTQEVVDKFTVFEGTGPAQGISLMAGDFFALTPAHTAGCSVFYDRASLIAMEPDMRANYARHLAMLMPVDARGLLLTISYDQSKMKGPPFAVTDDDVHSVLGQSFQIEELAHYSGPHCVGNLANRGLETLDERVYLLTRKL